MPEETRTLPPKTRRIPVSHIVDTAKYLVVIGVIIWLLAMGTNRLGYNWQWYRIPQYLVEHTEDGYAWGLLMQGLGVTFQITGISMILMLVIGLMTALMRMSRSLIASSVARAYMEIIRNSPCSFRSSSFISWRLPFWTCPAFGLLS